MPWLIGAAFGARTPTAEFMTRLKEAALEARFPSPNSDHDRGEHRWKCAFSSSKKQERKKKYLALGNHARSARVIRLSLGKHWLTFCKWSNGLIPH